LFYFAFAPSAWWYLLLPAHFIMGPIHGAIVNWCGHRYGYSNFKNGDDSKNTLIFDFLTLGELFQNNHHKYGASPNFAVRWFELDPAWQVMKVLNAVGVIKLQKGQKTYYPEQRTSDALREEQVQPQPVADLTA
jgi:stearoyl-CoA desaturase (delta-9 desaturase)